MIVYEYIKAARFPVRTAVHVGAHKATEADRYEQLGARRVVWIEADEEIAARARHRLAKREQSETAHLVVQALITDRDGVATPFHVFSNNGSSSSIFQFTDLAHEAWPDVRETGQVKTYMSTRLDTLLESQGVAAADVDLLTIDTQGAELLCLKGAGRYLDAASFIEVEMSSEAFYAGGALAADVDALLTAAGFSRISQIPRHGDTVYVRADRLGSGATAKLNRVVAARG